MSPLVVWPAYVGLTMTCFTSKQHACGPGLDSWLTPRRTRYWDRSLNLETGWQVWGRVERCSRVGDSRDQEAISYPDFPAPSTH